MTVSELRNALEPYDGNDLAPLDVVVHDLDYIVAALEQWQEIAELFGRRSYYEVQRFLSQAQKHL